MNLQILKRAAQTLSKCGIPQLPDGSGCLAITKKFLLQYFYPANASQAVITIEKEVTGPATGLVMPFAWGLKAISITQPADILLQIQLPDGNFLFGNPIRIDQIAGFGSYRYLFTNEKLVPLGSQLQITLTNFNLPNQQSIAILFEGSYKYLLQGAAGVELMDVGCMARYKGNPNRGLFVPAYMQGYEPQTQAGCYAQEYFTYSSDIQVLNSNGPFFSTASLQIDDANDFAARRRLFTVTWDAGVTAATVMVKARRGSGYILDDDYIITSFLNGTEMAHDWMIAAGEQVFFDLSLVDVQGTGNVTVQCHLEGVKLGRTARRAA